METHALSRYNVLQIDSNHWHLNNYILPHADKKSYLFESTEFIEIIELDINYIYYFSLK